MADDTEPLDTRAAPRSPVIQWLNNNSTWLGAIGAIATVAALLPVLFGSSETSVGNSVHVEGDNNGGQIAGGDITNIGDPQDGKTIASLLQANQELQKTVDKLVSRLPVEELRTNEQVREQITDAVTGLSDLDREPSQIKQAEAALAKGDAEQAQALYRADAENKTLAGEAQLRGAAESYRRLGALAFLDDTRGALEAYQNAVEAWPGDIRSWNQLGLLYQQTGQLDQSIEAHGKVSELAKYTDEPQAWTAGSLSNLGLVYQVRGDLDQAVELYEKALALNTELGSKAGMASIYVNLGVLHAIRGDLDQTVEPYEKALALHTELGSKAGMASDYGNMGIVQEKRGELDQAVELYEKALALNTELGSKAGMASNYANLGRMQETRGELDQAVELYEKALALNTELSSKAGMAGDYGNMGIVQEKRGELDRAIELYEKSLAISTELGSKAGMASNYANLGRMHKTRGELDQAREFWERSVVLFDEINSPNADRVSSWIQELDAE